MKIAKRRASKSEIPQANSLQLASMVLAKSKNAVGLGNSLMNDRFGRGKGADRKKVSAGIHRTDQSGQTVYCAISEDLMHL